MSEDRLLTPREAEAVIDERIEWFGLGAVPRVAISEREDGTWHVRWEEHERTVPPMTREGWYAWLEENIGSMDPGDLETTES